MIEDLQDEYKSYSVHDDNQPNRAGMLLIVFILWVIFTAVLLLISKPKIDVALKETNAVQVFKDRKNLRDQTEFTSAISYFVSMKDYSDYSLSGFVSSFKKGSADSRHDVLECLLKGPTDEALSCGAVTMIPSGTKLIGVSVSNNIAFVDLSSAFSQATDEQIEIARWQILKTLQSTDSSIREAVLLVNGNELEK